MRAEEVLKELKDIDLHIWWMDIGRYSEHKTIIIPKFASISKASK